MTDFDPDHFDRLAERFDSQKGLVKKTTEQLNDLKEMVRARLLDYGTPDEKGHVWLPGHKWMAKHEARRSTSFDYAKAEEYLRQSGDWEKGTRVVPEHREMTEDSFVGYAYENDLDPTDFYTVKETWAIHVTKEDQVEY